MKSISNQEKMMAKYVSFRMDLFVRWLSALAVVLSSGCCTIDSETPQKEFIEGEKVAGSDKYALSNVIVQSAPKGDFERFSVTADGVHSWQVSQQEKRWDEVSRTRPYAIAGVHDEYDAGNDIKELIVGPVSFPLVGAFAVASAPFAIFEWLEQDEDRSCHKFCLDLLAEMQYVYCIFPAVTWLDAFGTNHVHQTVCKNVMLHPAAPAEKREDCQVAFDLSVFGASGELLAKKRLTSDGFCDVPVCDALLKTPDNPKLTIKVESDTAKVEGQHVFESKFELEDLVRRKLAAKPAPQSVVPTEFVLSQPTFKNQRKGGKQVAGSGGVLSVSVANAGKGDGYGVIVEAVSKSGDVTLSNSAETLLLRAGKSSLVNVPFTIPMKTVDGQSEVQLVARDALGRKSAPLRVMIAYIGCAQPELQLTGAKLVPYQNEKDVYFLEIDIRNKGQGRAQKVRVTAIGEPNIGTLLDKECLIDEIDLLSRASARLRVRVPNGVAGQVLKVKVAVTEPLAAGNTAGEVEAGLPNAW